LEDRRRYRLPFQVQDAAKTDCRLILAAHFCAIDGKPSFTNKRPEGSCPRDLALIENHRTRLEYLHRHLQRAEAGVDLFGAFILAGLLLFQRSVLGEMLGMGRTFVIRLRCRIAGQTSQPVVIAVGQVG
jgi:hypothetical protein